jgi:hypothetical protein
MSSKAISENYQSPSDLETFIQHAFAKFEITTVSQKLWFLSILRILRVFNWRGHKVDGRKLRITEAA